MMSESLLSQSRRRLQNLRRDSNDDTALLGWLNSHNLSHLYSRIKKSNISIKKLSKYEPDTIRSTAQYKLKLSSTELATFISAVTQYRHLQLLTEREQRIDECQNHLNFLQNELDIKQSNDILFVQERFKKMVKMLKKRESQLVREITQKIEYKKAVLSDATDELAEYKQQVEQQRQRLMQTEHISTSDMAEDAADDVVALVPSQLTSEEQMMRTRRVLEQDVTAKFGKQRFSTIQNMSVEIPNYDELMAQLQRTGVVLDAFQFDMNAVDDDDDGGDGGVAMENETIAATYNYSSKSLKSDGGHGAVQLQVHMAMAPLDTKLQCLCGSQLVLSTVGQAYASQTRIYCQFCNFECAEPHSAEIWHCARGDIKAHHGGFDLCFLCGSKCFEARKADRQRQKEEDDARKRKTNSTRVKGGHRLAKSNDGLHRMRAPPRARAPRLVSSQSREHSAKNTPPKHSRSLSAMKPSQWERSRSFEQNPLDTFMYPSQLQTLTNIGCDPVKARRLITKYEGDMDRVMMEINKV